jgi:PAS domain S-box-containing protein
MKDLPSAIIETTSDAVIAADAKGKITAWNAAAVSLFGYSADEMIGQELTRIIPPNFRQAHDKSMSAAAHTGSLKYPGTVHELLALHRDGHEFPIELTVTICNVDGERFFGGIIRDIRERKEAEADIRRMNEELEAKNKTLEALSVKLAKYLSKQVYDSIFSGQRDVKIESYRKKLTVFFSDIQGFTNLTDSMEAEPLSELLNNYLGEMAAIAQEFGGTIDKFIGDGIMIFFGDPESLGEIEDAISCVKMALRMRSRIQELRKRWLDQGIPNILHVRIGINTGYCTVGNFGSEDRLDYTIVGGQVNAAARLETTAEPDQILISYATYALVKDTILCRPTGEIQVKGISHPIKTYEALATHEDAGAHGKRVVMQKEGFQLSMDQSVLSEEDRQSAREALSEALLILDEKGG